MTGKDRSDEGQRKGAWRGEEREARTRHAEHFLALAEQADPLLRGAE